MDNPGQLKKSVVCQQKLHLKSEACLEKSRLWGGSQTQKRRGLCTLCSAYRISTRCTQVHSCTLSSLRTVNPVRYTIVTQFWSRVFVFFRLSSFLNLHRSLFPLRLFTALTVVAVQYVRRRHFHYFLQHHRECNATRVPGSCCQRDDNWLCRHVWTLLLMLTTQ